MPTAENIVSGHTPRVSTDDHPGVQLPGGVANAGRVTRVGNLVRRPAPHNASTIHALLVHLADVGFAAPGPRALNPDGYELVDFLPGDVAVSPFPAWSNADSTLVAVGRLLRRYHDAVAGFDMPSDATWSRELSDPAGGPIVCHNDVCIENVVFENVDFDERRAAVGLLDFDFAAPGRPLWDLVHTARYWVPLTDPGLAAPTRGRLDPFARLRLIVDAYGLTAHDRQALPDVIFEAEAVALQFVLARVEEGHPAFSWDAPAQDRYDRKLSWLRANRNELRRTVSVGA
jgi:Phosphotransferase enzyme family